MDKTISQAFCGLIFGMSAFSAQGISVYENNFDGTENFAGGVSGALSGVTTLALVPTGYAGTGIFSGMMLHNATGIGGSAPAKTTLTLSGLPSHDTIDIDFALAIIDSWDSSDGSPSPDYFNVTVDGVSVFQETYANASGSVNYSDPDNTLVPTTGDLGFTGGPFFDADRAYNAAADSAFSVAHTASTVTIEFFASGVGWQGGIDESWGMDNLSVSATTVPIPGAFWLLGSAMCGLLFKRQS